MSLKENIKDCNVLIRGLFILIYAVIFYFLLFIIGLVVVFLFLTKLITAKLNVQLLDFSGSLIIYVSQILDYMTFRTDIKPFPFSPFPERLDDTQEIIVEEKDNVAKGRAKKVVKRESKKS